MLLRYNTALALASKKGTTRRYTSYRRVVVLVDIFTIRCDKLNQRMVFAADVAKEAGASKKDSKGCCQQIIAIGSS